MSLINTLTLLVYRTHIIMWFFQQIIVSIFLLAILYLHIELAYWNESILLKLLHRIKCALYDNPACLIM